MSIADISGISNLKYQQCIKRYTYDNMLLPKTLALKFYMGKKNLFLFCVFSKLVFNRNLADPTLLVVIVIVHFGL